MSECSVCKADLSTHTDQACLETVLRDREAARAAIRNLAPLGGCREHVYPHEDCSLCTAIQRAQDAKG